ncbi:MAG TPA: hypothetical protein PKC45_18095, partial [Gemmatales bacterium]|nr:hypothetical protein [Gemmatales bacterium]
MMATGIGSGSGAGVTAGDYIAGYLDGLHDFEWKEFGKATAKGAGYGAMLGVAARLSPGIGYAMLVLQVQNTVHQLREGHYFSATWSIASAGVILAAQWGLSKACFVAGTKLWTPQGFRAIEASRVGDRVYARDEDDPDGPAEFKLVEEI